jgi:hypothetical protein
MSRPEPISRTQQLKKTGFPVLVSIMIPLVLPKSIIRMDIFGRWQNCHISSLACGARAIIIGKASGSL